MNDCDTTAVIVAAGSGQRCGGGIPKQFQTINNRWVLDYSIEKLAKLMPVIIVVGKEWQEIVRQTYPQHQVVVGGESRLHSVQNALSFVKTARVCIHDAARPFVKKTVIEELLKQQSQAVIPVIDSVDTLKIVNNNIVTQTVNRDFYKRVQTPQLFKTAILKQLHADNQDKNITDDAGLFENAGIEVQTVQGHPETFKITTPEDLAHARQLYEKPIVRIGSGFDVHAFSAGDHIMLGGVKVPHHRGLAAHSDGDVLLHALIDAILGAVGAGDIGLHFPPSDAQWKNKASSVFLAHALKLMQQQQLKIENVDLTIIGEDPKINPYRQAITENLQHLLQTKMINVKATTTEKLGFAGRKEGLAVMASVLLRGLCK